MLIHGGGWIGGRRAAFRAEVATAPIFQRLGYLTVTVDYRGGGAGLTDIEHYYDLIRHRYGSRLPVCAIGMSAGGNLALLLAAHRRDLRCTISLAGPTDLPALRHEPGGGIAYQLAVRAFGTANLNRYSPIRYVHSIRARVMLLYARTDPIVPVAQGIAMAKALPGATLITLPPGGTTFVHSRVNAAAAHRAEVAEVLFLARATSGGG